MVKGLKLIAFLLTLCVISVKSQTISPDGLGNFWLIDGISILKIDGSGNTLAINSNQMLGKPHNVDAADPFRVMVFYQSTQNVAFLDNNASLIGKHVYLGNLSLGEVTLVCRSARGGVWLYHREGWEIVRTDSQVSRIEQRIALPKTFNQSHANFMIEHQKMLYLGVNNELIVPFDLYGLALQPIDIEYNGEFGFYQNNLFAVSNDTVNRMSIVDKKIFEKYYCPCNSFPLIINNTPHCVIEKSIKPCKKIE